MENQLRYACLSHRGKRRENNEDNFWCDGRFLPADNDGTGEILTGDISWEGLPVFGLFDGMGGESSGEVAAHLAASSLGGFVQEETGLLKKDPKEFLKEACRRMNREVCRYQQEHKIHSMGSTANLAVFCQGRLYAANLGDSRTYHVQGGRMHRISTDHVYPGGFFAKAPLTQYLGLDEEEMQLSPSLVSIPCQAGDRILLCSDGVTDLLQEMEIEDVINRHPSLAEAAGRLLELALERGGRDNITLILVEIPEALRLTVWERLRRLLGGKRR